MVALGPRLREVWVNRVDEQRCWDLFVKERSQLLSYVKRLAPPGCDSVDVVQEVGVRLLCHPDAAIIRDRLSECRKSVARHIVLHELRAARYERAKLAALDVRRNADAWEPERRAAIRSTLARELGRLDPLSRDLLLRRYVLEQTSDEIARDIALSPAAVRMRLMRVRAVLAAELEPKRRQSGKSRQRNQKRRAADQAKRSRAARERSNHHDWTPPQLAVLYPSHAMAVGQPLSP